MKKALAFLAPFLALTAGSIAHGRDWVSKGILVAVACFILAGITWWLSGAWYGAVIGIIAGLHFWFLRRNSKEAHASLSEIDLPERDDSELLLAQMWTSTITSIVLLILCIVGENWWLLLLAAVAPWMTNLMLYLAVPLIAMSDWPRWQKRMVSEGLFGAACALEVGLFMWFGSVAVGVVRGWIG